MGRWVGPRPPWWVTGARARAPIEAGGGAAVAVVGVHLVASSCVGRGRGVGPGAAAKVILHSNLQEWSVSWLAGHYRNMAAE